MTSHDHKNDTIDRDSWCLPAKISNFYKLFMVKNESGPVNDQEAQYEWGSTLPWNVAPPGP